MTAAEVIAALDGYLTQDEPFDPVETAESALEILKRAAVPVGAVRRLEAWLKNEDPYMPEDLCRTVLHWVRATEEMTT